DVAISSYFEFPIDAYTSIWGGQEIYPEPEPFECQSDFQLFGQGTWSDLLDGQATIWLYYETVIIGEGGYVESGHITLDRAYLVVDGVIPEPTTILLLLLGISGIRAKRRNPNRQ
ncbi:MAG: PEP-CTERM sorting domain-containing protein, partial [Sedimentisphaerales bacterium]|nr:PEP-CTERM sorting domain-containing protein [Sedimentisphaerales bacterium]